MGGLEGCELRVHSWLADQLAQREPRPLPSAKHEQAKAAAPSRDHRRVRSVAQQKAPALPAIPAQQLKEDAQLLREVFRVVLLRDPSSPEEFNDILSALAQGGTIEGAYNGMVSSESYHALEAQASLASDQALQVFSEELIELEKELPQPTDFDIAAPLTGPKVFARFRQASIYTLKRVLANEALKVMEAKEGIDRPVGTEHAAPSANLVSWYSQWASRLAMRKVDFGLSLRNSPDPLFHSQWAAHAPRDRLTWEVLNRVHRLLDFAQQGARQGEKPTGKSK